MSKEADNWTGCYEGGWQGLIVPEAFAHPAKFSYSLTERMISHAIRKGWITKGSVVVDPFGGVGCGGIVAAYNDLVWIGVELEEKFVDLGRLNFGLHQGKLAALGCPQPKIILGDSRKLCEVLESADIVVSSPPYAESMESGPGGIDWGKANRPDRQRSSERRHSVISENAPTAYGTTPGQLGAMKAGSCDAVISSPPYTKDGLGHRRGDTATKRELAAGIKQGHTQGGFTETYGQTPGNLGNLRPGCLKDVDCVVSSPPYEGCQQVDNRKTFNKCHAEQASHLGWGTQSSANNLGKEQGPTFWQAAREIVRQCHQILKPGGHAIWVVKAFVRKGAIVDFPGDWERLCESVGFVTVCRHRAMLVKETTHDGLFEPITEKKERKSFFRRLAESKGSPRIDFEMVLCMQRGDGK